MSDVLSNLFLIILYIFFFFCIQYLFNAFLYSRFSKYSLGFVWVIYQVICIMLGLNFYSSSILNLIIYICILLLFSLFCYRGNFLLKLFLVVQFTAIHELSIWASNSLIYFSSKVADFICICVEQQIISLKTFELVISISTMFFIVITGIVREVITFLFIEQIVKSYQYHQRFEKQVMFYLLPASAGVLTSALIRLLILTIENGYVTILYEKYPLLYLIIPLIAITLLIANLFSFKTFQKMIEAQQERAEKIVLENQIIGLQNSLAEIENIKMVKHDMKNHMAILQNLLNKWQRSGDNISDEINQYFEEFHNTVEQLDNQVHTGNLVSDVVINSKFQYAKKEINDIRLDASEFLINNEISAFDIGIILSNGLDNAIEACKNLREVKPNANVYILIKSFWKGKMLFIEIENSFCGVIKMDIEGDLPQSTKQDNDIHGIGLKNIRNCAKKYNGDIDCIVQENRFILSVMVKGR